MTTGIIEYKKGTGYLIYFSKIASNELLGLGVKLVNTGKYGRKSIRSFKDKTTKNNLKALKRIK